MTALELDATDAAIVRELQADGRLAFETLAGRIGLSRAAARLRVRRLLEQHAIRVIGVVHPSVRDIRAGAHLSIGVEGEAARTAGEITRLPEVSRVGLTAGRVPLTAEVHGHDLAHLSDVVDRVRAASGVRRIDTFVYTRVLKDPLSPPSGPPTVDPDELDLRLMALLEADGRLSFAELAGHVGLSAGAVRSRVLRLIEGSVVRVTAQVDPKAIGLGRLGGFALRMDASADGAAEEIASWERTRFLARGLGGADLLGTVAASSMSGLYDAQERMRALPGVHDLETWLHLDPAAEEGT